MNKLATKPFVEDVFDMLALSTVFNTDGPGMRLCPESLKSFSIAELWMTFLRRSGKCHQCT
jgi:hypothetical protein